MNLFYDLQQTERKGNKNPGPEIMHPKDPNL